MNSSSPQQEKNLASSSLCAGEIDTEKSCKRFVRYKECLKNHAAAIGGNATDGCGEFMPSGEEGTIEALKCSACNCHRNFHRKEIECDSCHFQCYGRRLSFGQQNCLVGEKSPLQQALVSGKSGSVRSESDEKVAKPAAEKMMKKRFRTKFTQEQKEKMMNFAEKADWGIQKLDESVVQQFCQEIGIERRVLKVWMHNNKHSLAKKNNNITS